MDDSSQPPPIEHVVERLEQSACDEALACLERIETASVDDRKTALRSLQTVAEDRPAVLSPICSALTPFLEDDERSVRLTTAKLFVTLAESDSDAVIPIVSSLADRFADEDEFYYVRARAAEALGYVALEHPQEVASPEVLADLRIGLSFDEPEVKQKLAKALEYVALGNPDRLRHHVPTLADHLDDGNELVRYHLATALVAVGSEYPDRLSAVRDELVARLDDENDHVRGRAAEGLGLLTWADADAPAVPESLRPEEPDDEDPFVSDRLRFVVDVSSGSRVANDVPAEIGTLDGVRETTGDAVDAITSPDGDEECPHCGRALPETGPPMCPRCGAPY